jgi:hypothetical protein
VEGYFSDIVFENFINKKEIKSTSTPPWTFISRESLREVVSWLLSNRPKNGAEVTRAILPLLLLIPTAIFLLSASSTTNAEIIYKPGDWLLYRFTFNYTVWECTYLFRVTVKNIKGTMVLYSSSFEKKEKGDPSLCGYEIPLPIRIEVPYTSDISQEKPGSLYLFINPAYTGEYKISETTYRYYKGILIYHENRIETRGPDLSLRVELVDTSIQELKALINPSGVTIAMIGLILVVLATIIITAIFIVVKRRRKTTETPLNQSQAT